MPRNIFHLECKASKAKNRGELMIYSSISPYSWDRDNPEVTSRNFDQALKELGDVDEITVRINSPGGAVSEAVAIRTALMKHRARKTIDIEGSCCSAATIIACLPGARVRMAKGGDYMIHRCSWIAIGHADAMLSAYQSMTNTDNDLAEIYAERTGMSREACYELMKAETWYSAEGAREAGFVDEVLSEPDSFDEPIAACSANGDEILNVMRECYDHVPAKTGGTGNRPDEGYESTEENGQREVFTLGGEHTEPDGRGPSGPQNVSNEDTAVAAGNSSENRGLTAENEGGNHMELRDATAEMIQSENPDAAQAIASAAREEALTAERERIAQIRRLTPRGRGAKWETMRDEAIENGTSAQAYWQQILEEEDKAGQTWLEQRTAETAQADKIGAGDAGDNDSRAAMDQEDKAAKEIAELAKSMSFTVSEMA